MSGGATCQGQASMTRASSHDKLRSMRVSLQLCSLTVTVSHKAAGNLLESVPMHRHCLPCSCIRAPMN